MPQPDDPTRLPHILDAARDISDFLRGRTRQDLDRDRMLVLALIKSVENIGEAASKISPEGRSRWPHIPWRQASSMRNRLVHGYFEIDLDRVWDSATMDVPALVPLVEAALKSG